MFPEYARFHWDKTCVSSCMNPIGKLCSNVPNISKQITWVTTITSTEFTWCIGLGSNQTERQEQHNSKHDYFLLIDRCRCFVGGEKSVGSHSIGPNYCQFCEVFWSQWVVRFICSKPETHNRKILTNLLALQ